MCLFYWFAFRFVVLAFGVVDLTLWVYLYYVGFGGFWVGYL